MLGKLTRAQTLPFFAFFYLKYKKLNKTNPESRRAKHAIPPHIPIINEPKQNVSRYYFVTMIN